VLPGPRYYAAPSFSDLGHDRRKRTREFRRLKPFLGSDEPIAKDLELKCFYRALERAGGLERGLRLAHPSTTALDEPLAKDALAADV